MSPGTPAARSGGGAGLVLVRGAGSSQG